MTAITPGMLETGAAADAGNPAEADRRADDDRVGLARLVEIGRIAGAACDLGASVDAGQRCSDDVRRHAASPAISRARTMVRGNSSTL